MSTEDGAPGVGSRWCVEVGADIVITDVRPWDDTMAVCYQLVGSKRPERRVFLDDWKRWVASGRVVKLKEEATNAR